jgi:uncharacterized protein YoxC
MNTELSLTIIAISFVILTIFAIVTLIFFIKLFIVIRKTTQNVEHKVNPILDEAKRVAHLTGNTSEMIRDNVELTKPFFQSMRKISSIIDDIPHRLKNDMHDNTMTINFETKKDKTSVSDWAEWLARSIVLIQKLRRK